MALRTLKGFISALFESGTALNTNGQIRITGGDLKFYAGGTEKTVPVTAFADPMTTPGDVIIRDALNATTRLAVGSANQSLKVSATGVPAWSSTGLPNWVDSGTNFGVGLVSIAAAVPVGTTFALVYLRTSFNLAAGATGGVSISARQPGSGTFRTVLHVERENNSALTETTRESAFVLIPVNSSRQIETQDVGLGSESSVTNLVEVRGYF